MILLARIKFIPVLICLLIFSNCWSQAPAIDSLFMAKNDSADILPLPPLDTLIAWAKLHSPLMHEQDALIEKNNADLRRIKKLLLDAVKLNSGFQYGNYGDPTQNRLLTGYASGINVSFSLYQLFGQKNNVQVFNAERKVSEYKKDEIAMDVEKLVTMLYNNAQAQKAILKIRSEGSYSAYTHMGMAEKEFREGSIEVGELSRVTEIYTKALVDYQLAVNDLKNYYQEIEITVGVPLSSYKAQ